MNLKSFEKKEKNLAEMTVEVTGVEFEAALDSAYKKAKNQITVSGFRKGKAPRKIVENTYGKTVFYEDALDILMPSVYAFGVQEAKVETVGYPKILDVDFADGTGVTITVEIATYPTAEITDYKGVGAPRDSIEVSDEEVEAEVQKAVDRAARMTTVEREAQMGDTANIDYAGTMDGVPFDGGTDTGHDLILGSNSFIEGFEEQIVGMKAGEERDINVTFPKDYAEDLAGKDAVFHIVLNEVKTRELPELDDEFAKDVSECDTMAEYRESIRKDIAAKKDKDAQSKFEEAVMDALAEKLVCDVPEVMVDELVENQIDGLRRQLQGYGMDMDSYMGAVGSSVDIYRKSMRPRAEKDIRVMLALEKIGELEDFEISDEAKEEKYAEYAAQYGAEIEQIKESLPEAAVMRDLKMAAARKFVIDNAVVVEAAEEPKEEKKPAKKTTRKSTKKTAEKTEAEAPVEEKPAEEAKTEE